MSDETLEDHLRRATRHFNARLPETEVLGLGRDLALELRRAHAEDPPRFPEFEPALVPVVDGKPRLTGTRPGGDAGEDLFRLGSLLCWLAGGTRPEVSWRLDGPPPPPMSTLGRRAVLSALAAPRRADRFPSAAAAAEALEAALREGPEKGSPWPLFRGDPSRRGQAAAAVHSLALAWDARLGTVHSSPAVWGAMVVAATTDGRLVFLDGGSGRRVHELAAGKAIESSPAVAEGLLHIGNDEGELLAVGLDQGEVRWRLRLGQLVRSSPLTVGGRVVVGVVESKTAGSLVALDAARGKPAWTRKMGAVFSSPALAGQAVLVGSDDGRLHAVDADKGTVLWSQALGGKVRATPAVTPELAVVGSFEGRLAAVRLSDGSLAWSVDLGHAIYSSACIAGGLAVVGCHDGHLHGFELASGRAVFEAQTRGPVVASPLAAGERVLAASTDGAVYVLDLSGEVLHRLAVSPRGIQSSPASDGRAVFVGSADGVHALHLGGPA